MMTVTSCTWRWPSTSRAEAIRLARFIGRRRAGGSVSGWRRFTQSEPTSASSTKDPKTPRQPTRWMTTAPTEGATAGTRMKIIMTKLVIRAISRPWYRSRTSASDTIRGPAAPSPWTKRATSSISSDCAKTAAMEASA